MTKQEMIDLFNQSPNFTEVGQPKAEPTIATSLQLAKANWYMIAVLVTTATDVLSRAQYRFIVIDEGLGTEAAFFDGVNPTIVPDNTFRDAVQAFIDPWRGIINKIDVPNKWARVTGWILNGQFLESQQVEIREKADGTLAFRKITEI